MTWSFSWILLDSRFVGYLPSVLATATMMEVIDQIEPHKTLEHQDKLLGVLKMNKVCSRKSLITSSFLGLFETPFFDLNFSNCI